MAIADPAILAFNRGLISQLGLARTDLKRMALSASVQTNLMPRMLGSAIFRPGKQYVLSSYDAQKPKYLPFVFSTTDVALLECTPNILRPILPGSDGTPSVPLSRVSVGSTVTNGTFSGNITGWTNADQSGATSEWVSGNYMSLIGNGSAAAKEYQKITVAAGDQNKEHALRIVVQRGVVTLNVGTSAGDGAYAFNLALGTGTHSIAFTPTGDFYVQFSNVANMPCYVQSIAVEGAGGVVLPTPWGASDLPNLRWEQSAEEVYVAWGGQQQKIQRWGKSGSAGYRSWSIVQYLPLDGPFLVENVTGTTITPSGEIGSINLVASAPLFRSGHVGALFRLASSGGQNVNIAAGGTGQWSSAIEVTGTGSGRYVTVEITGTFSATVVLQQSVGATGDWTDVGTVAPGTAGIPSTANWTGVGNASTWTAPVNGSFNDGWDNTTIYYRIGIKDTYTSGTANCGLFVVNGSITGVCRVTAVTDSEHATADVLTQPGNTGVLTGLGNANATADWWEGAWSDEQGWPDAVALYEGRLCWAGSDRIVCSVSDAYESFDDTVVGDSGPINQQIGSGPVDTVNWLLPAADLVMDTPAREITVRSSLLGGIVTPTDFVMKDCSTQGGAAVPALKIDFNGIFLQRSGRRIYLLKYTPSFFGLDYAASDLTNFVPDIAIMENGAPLSAGGFTWLALQRQPDTRIHALLNDGTARVLVWDDTEDEHAWIKVQTAATKAGACKIVDCVVLPGQGGASSAEDLVYYVVERTVYGSTAYYLERWAREDECIGQALSKNVDSHLAGTNSPASASISLPHLVGETVVVWADGASLGSYAVGAGGAVTLSKTVTNWCAGLSYAWQFQSTKLAYAAQLGSALTQKKKIARLGIVAANMAQGAIQYASSLSGPWYDLPSTYKGAAVTSGEVLAAWDDEGFAFPGEWDTDSRLCLQGQSPLPAILLAAVIDMETRERP